MTESLSISEPAYSAQDDELDFIIVNLFSEEGNSKIATRRISSQVNERTDSTLVEMIEQKIQTKTLPLALRKRLMYQRAVSI